MKVLALRGVRKVYRRSHLGRLTETVGLDGLDLEVERGEVFGLLGLNGSGKTTAIKLLMGLHLPTCGTVEVFGKPVPDIESLARIGYAPEAAYLNRALTGRENIRLFAALSRIPACEREARVLAMLRRVGLERGMDQRLSEYSKGMLQRVSLAQALIHEPELVILDEPVTGLDPLAIKEVRALILWLKGKGKSVLFSSHDISEVEKVCDRIGILSGGRLARVMTQEEWQGRPGALEEAFAASVTRTDGVGEIRLD
ncbi:MAG: ABC transporter ATP-binding protein [Elusimicrobia bacterium]|nr:ABC transporter ATP-binding protein [Elusimicrobiota bacterium]MDE2236559.1 ABC transporter ATP-binding protein [Elusimicrobiota bacterium]MDE2424925.1 ABC transporter ATP-binding protein [Elusimicrobiota bacterium]